MNEDPSCSSTVYSTYTRSEQLTEGFVVRQLSNSSYVCTELGDALLLTSSQRQNGSEEALPGTRIRCKVIKLHDDGPRTDGASYRILEYTTIPLPDGWTSTVLGDNMAFFSCLVEFRGTKSLHIHDRVKVFFNQYLSEVLDLDRLVSFNLETNRYIRVTVKRIRSPKIGISMWVIASSDNCLPSSEGETSDSTHIIPDVHGIVSNCTHTVYFVATKYGDAVLTSRDDTKNIYLGAHLRCTVRSQIPLYCASGARFEMEDHQIVPPPEGWDCVDTQKNMATLVAPAEFSHYYRSWIVLRNDLIAEIFDMSDIVGEYCRKYNIDPCQLFLSRVYFQKARLKGEKGVSGWVIVGLDEEERRESMGNEEMQRKREVERYREESQRMSSEKIVPCSIQSAIPPTNQSIDGFVIKKWGVYFVVWTPNGLSLIFDDLSVKGKKAELGSFLSANWGESDLPSPILDRRLTYTQRVIDYSVEDIQRYGRGIERGEHAMISCRIHFLEFRRRLLPVSSSESGLPSRNAIFKHPFLGEIVDDKMLIQNPAPGDSYQVIVKGIPINELTIGWIVEREDGEEKERSERVEEEIRVTNDNGSQLLAETTEIPSETASSVEGSQIWESLLRRAFSLQTVRDILKKEDEQLFGEIINQLLD